MAVYIRFTTCICLKIGLKFWKVNARKFLAVPEESLGKPAKMPRAGQIAGLDASPQAVPCNDCCRDIVDDMKRKLDLTFKVAAGTKIPIGLQKLLADGFKCKICQSVIKPPVIASNCCKQLLGCDACIKTWYQDSPTTKNCPWCNKEKGFPETMRLHGLDELLLATKDLVDDILDDAISVAVDSD